MDELTAALAGSFQVTHHPNNPAAPHPRFQSLYKTKGSVLDQHERRHRAIQYQKKGRFDQLSHMRKLADDVWDDKHDSKHGAEEEDMETAPPAKRRPGSRYKNQLMLSEWLLEMPENFESDWVMVPCPVGKRNLVIAARGLTYAYAKSGYLMKEFPSWLPGGNRSGSKYWEDVTILDCVFVENMKTFFILDLMCWRSHPIYDTETEFRFFWLNSQLQELPKLSRVTKGNHFKFVALPNFACDKQNLQGVMMTPMTTELDGLLFYHKFTHYTFGPTPLVLWLKAYMLPEILGVQVALYHFAQKPGNYKDFATHVEEVKKEQGKGNKKKSRGYGAQNPSVTPGQLDPENYPRELQGSYQPERRRNRTYSEGTNRTPGNHGGNPKGHKSHGGRSPGAQQYDKAPSVLQKEKFHASAANSGFTFTVEDVRIKDGTLWKSPPDGQHDEMETLVNKSGHETSSGGDVDATFQSLQTEQPCKEAEQSSQSEQKSSEETMDGVQSGSKKKGKRNKKGRRIAAKMDM